jgi:hypothetical protein
MRHWPLFDLRLITPDPVRSSTTTPPLQVSRKLGYEPDGVALHARRGARATEQRLHLTRAGWERFQSGPAAVPVRIDGLEPCLPLFGLEPVSEPNGRVR